MAQRNAPTGAAGQRLPGLMQTEPQEIGNEAGDDADAAAGQQGPRIDRPIAGAVGDRQGFCVHATPPRTGLAALRDELNELTVST
jgi:hypothetical protein